MHELHIEKKHLRVLFYFYLPYPLLIMDKFGRKKHTPLTRHSSSMPGLVLFLFQEITNAFHWSLP